MVFFSSVLLFYFHAFIRFLFFAESPNLCYSLFFVLYTCLYLLLANFRKSLGSLLLIFLWICSSCKSTDVPADSGAITVWPKAYQHISYQQSIISYQAGYTGFSSLRVIFIYTKLRGGWGASKEYIWLHKETDSIILAMVATIYLWKIPRSTTEWKHPDKLSRIPRSLSAQLFFISFSTGLLLLYVPSLTQI